MLKRIKAIEEKLDEVLKNQETQANMIASVIETIDSYRSSGNNQKRQFADYLDNVIGIMRANGAPPEMLDQFKTMFGGIR